MGLTGALLSMAMRLIPISAKAVDVGDKAPNFLLILGLKLTEPKKGSGGLSPDIVGVLNVGYFEWAPAG